MKLMGLAIRLAAVLAAEFRTAEKAIKAAT
jgi:hypothetical protein